MKTLNDFIKESLNEARRNIEMGLDNASLESAFNDLDATINDIWNNSGKKFPYTNNVIIYPIESKLADAIIEKHKDKLPTEKEFESLIDFLIYQDSANLTTEVINKFIDFFVKEPLVKTNSVQFSWGFHKVKIEDWTWDIWRDPDDMLEFDGDPSKMAEAVMILKLFYKKSINRRHASTRAKIEEKIDTSFDKYFKYWNTNIKDFPDYWTNGISRLKMFKGRSVI